MKDFILTHKLVKILLVLWVILLLIALIVFVFLKLWLPFGGTSSKDDKINYGKRAKNYKDGKFYNQNKFKKIYNDAQKNIYVSKKDTKPIDKVPIAKPSYLNNPSIDILNIAWLGHSSILMQMHSMNILIDPVFSDYASPLSFIGPSRFSELPIDEKYLPNIDIVVITHDHYDHLDYNTIKKIDSKVSKYIVPLGVEKHLERWNIDKNKIINMAWWEEININGLTIGCTPARHYSSRSLNDSFNTLWSSWVFIDEYHKVFDSGDTGFDTHFEDIYNKYSDFDLALLDSGQYDNRWKSTHMVPEEAVKAGMILKSKVIMPIHYGAFKLSNHPWDDGVERFSIKADKENINYITPKIGETITYSKNMNTDKWWKNIK